MTKTSSRDAAARTMVGMPFSAPCPRSMKRIIRGTTTAGDTAARIDSYQLQTYTYIYQASYGSPEVDHATPKITGATVGKDNKSVRLKVDGLVKGHVHHLVSGGVRSKDGLPLLHPNAYYTLNEIPAK